VYIYIYAYRSSHLYQWAHTEGQKYFEFCRIEACHTHERAISHTRTNFAHINESSHAHEWVKSQTWMCHVKHTDPCIYIVFTQISRTQISHVACHASAMSWYKKQWVIAHMWPRHCTYINESRHPCAMNSYTKQWVIAHMWLSHGTHMNESRHTCAKSWYRKQWVIAHLCPINGTWMSRSGVTS